MKGVRRLGVGIVGRLAGMTWFVGVGDEEGGVVVQ